MSTAPTQPIEDTGELGPAVSYAKPGPPRRVGSRAKRIPYGLILRRLLVIPVLIFLIATGAFFALRAIPGDPAELIAGSNASPETVQEIRRQLGTDRPVMEQYGDLMLGLPRGDLGTSYSDRRPVLDTITDLLPIDLVLVGSALAVAVVAGVAVGTVGAYWRRRWPDKAAGSLVGLFQATPDFVVGLVLILLFTFQMKIFPQPTGQLGLGAMPPPDVTGVVVIDAALAGEWSTFREALSRLVLPAVSLATVIAAVVARVTRAGVIDGLRSSQSEYGRALGLRERTIVLSALTSSRTAIITYVAVIFGSLVGGAAIIQTVFNWQGLGKWGLDAIAARDLPAIQGFVIVTGTITLLVYIALDVAVALLDPRIRLK